MYWPTIAGAVNATLSQSGPAAGQGDFFYHRGLSPAARIPSVVLFQETKANETK